MSYLEDDGQTIISVQALLQPPRGLVVDGMLEPGEDSFVVVRQLTGTTQGSPT